MIEFVSIGGKRLALRDANAVTAVQEGSGSENACYYEGNTPVEKTVAIYFSTTFTPVLDPYDEIIEKLGWKKSQSPGMPPLSQLIGKVPL